MFTQYAKCESARRLVTENPPGDFGGPARAARQDLVCIGNSSANGRAVFQPATRVAGPDHGGYSEDLPARAHGLLSGKPGFADLSRSAGSALEDCWFGRCPGRRVEAAGGEAAGCLSVWLVCQRQR